MPIFQSSDPHPLSRSLAFASISLRSFRIGIEIEFAIWARFEVLVASLQHEGLH